MYSLIALYLLFYDVVPSLAIHMPPRLIKFWVGFPPRRSAQNFKEIGDRGLRLFSNSHLARIIRKLVSRYAAHVLSVHEAMSDHR